MMHQHKHSAYQLLFRIFLYPILVYVIILLPFVSTAQISAHATINRNEIRIGEPIELTLSLEIQNPSSAPSIKWTYFKDTINKYIEIIDASKVDTIQKNSTLFIQQKLKVSVYDSGQYVIPSIQFRYANDSTQFVSTPTILINVHTVPTDTSETSIKDIKPIFEEPFDIKWYMPLIIKILIALLIIALIVFLIYRYFKKKKTIQIQEKPKLPPHIVALEKLKDIQQKEIWKEGKVKEYYSAISDTIREYIEGRYHVPALEQTSFETMQSLRFKAIDANSRDKLKYILELSDLVKFAKFIPIENDHHQILQYAFDFVNQTQLPHTTSEVSHHTAQNHSSTISTQNHSSTSKRP